MVTSPAPGTNMPGSGGIGTTPQGPAAALGIPDTQDYPRLVFTAPYFEQVPLAELIAPSVQEATEALLPTLVPPYVQDAANTAVQQSAVLLTGSTMTGALFLNPVMPTQPSQAASMAYVDALVATAGIPEVPPTPAGQLWGRETGQWVPINLESGVFLPLAGGVMGGQINMSGNSIINLAPVPQMPYGAAPAQWVLNQIAASSLYQGTWNADTNTPDLTLSGLWQNGFTWLVVTSNPSGIVVSEDIPGLTGNTVYDGNTIIYSTVDGAFAIVGGAALTVDQANALYLQLIGGQMSGNLLLNANATQAMQATTLQQVQALIAASVFPEPPNDGQTYGRNGLQLAWLPVLNVAGGVMTGPITLSGNVTGALQAVPLQQVQSLITAGVASYLPLAGGALTGPLTTTSTITVGSSSASTPGPLSVGGQGINYLTLGAAGQNIGFSVVSGALWCYQSGTALAGPFATVPQLDAYLPLTGGTVTGNLILGGTSSLTVGGAASVTGAAIFGGTVEINGLVTNSAGEVINVAGAVLPAASTPPALWIAGAYCLLDGAASPTAVIWRTSGGTFAAPTALASGATLASLAASGYNGSAYSSNIPFISLTANQAWTPTANGTSLNFGAIPSGSTAVVTGMTLSGTSLAISVPMTTGPVAVNSGQAFPATAGALNVNGGGIVLGPATGSWTGTINAAIIGAGGIIAPYADNVINNGFGGRAWQAVYSYAFNNSSDPRSKKDARVAPPGALDLIRKIPVHQFRWKNRPDDAPLHRGLMADQVLRSVGEGEAFIHICDDNDKTLLLDQSNQMGWLWQAIQELADSSMRTCDPQVKTNLGNYTTGVSVVSQLQPILFQYNGLANTPNDAAITPVVTRVGLDASAVQTILPEAVVSRQAPLHPTDTTDATILTINSDYLIYTLINACKELIARVQALEAAAGITPSAAETA